MTITNLKDLSKLIATCRKLGVDEIEIDGIKLKLGAAPATTTPSKRRQLSAKETVADAIETSGLSPEDMLFYSVSGQLDDMIAPQGEPS